MPTASQRDLVATQFSGLSVVAAGTRKLFSRSTAPTKEETVLESTGGEHVLALPLGAALGPSGERGNARRHSRGPATTSDSRHAAHVRA